MKIKTNVRAGLTDRCGGRCGGSVVQTRCGGTRCGGSTDYY
ncbi:MAG TPA: hypothetical protein VF688_03070 [Allosphingosinicella sp.]|jgi:hypothetical protein